ncbi:alpha/beta hydrolase [Oerskovia turbata]|uniref:Alpha/beta hydrolase n=1 Tax=Oerskovia turbata TaxID=1713 RepID=A0A4Q1KPD7_9CELL|nr:alpha/beta hydrolase [Oerskovia turbata]RXR21767.1 alpha/beta hydrolase [Oerskovia turbata]RXR31435.1 alpha/beta hydrolase [Oerskovia turbata]TGJ95964.1 alpha/beta hydrolase [Actinotalea fermentans ATCC 43279 = JCM 9966 = DSM 3133]
MPEPHAPTAETTGWVPDVLDGFEQLTLPLDPDDEGEVVATLVRRRRGAEDDEAGTALPGGPHPAGVPDRGIDVLYVHGWSDYFFQTGLADFWEAQGARFFALDLRKYGRSLRPGQTPGFVTDLLTYDEDIEAALAATGHGVLTADPVMRKRALLLMGHSTGGLTLSLWTARHQGRVAGLVLNSPWLEFQARDIGRKVLAPAITLRARLDPRVPLPQVDLGFYTRSVSRTLDGEWDYDLTWRPVRGFVVHGGWLAAILRGQAAVELGLGIRVPVLVLLSTSSTLLPRWTPEMMHSDTALDVVGIARRSTDLGSLVVLARIEGALHDVVLSAAPVRAAAYAQIATWVRGYVPGAGPQA